MGMYCSLAPRVTQGNNFDPTYVNGYLDSYSLNGVSGWAGPGPTHVTITVNGVLLATIATTDTRPDVTVAYGYVSTGFGYTFSPPLDSSLTQSITVACQGHTLNNGQVVITSGGGTGTAYYADPATQLPPVVQGLAATMPSHDSELESHPSVLMYCPFTDDANIQSHFQGASTFFGTSPTINQPSVYYTDPLTGVRMIEVPIYGPLNGVTGSSWFHKNVDQTINELWHRYLFLVDPDVLPVFNSSGVQTQGMTEFGTKMPGMAGAYERTGQWGEVLSIIDNKAWSYRMEHARPINGLFPLTFYAYDYEFNGIEGNTFGSVQPVGQVALRPGQIYCIEQRIKLNTMSGTTANADGERQIWVDGALVYTETGRKIRGDARAQFDETPFASIFHGGSTQPIGTIHYRYGGVCTATQYIGPPKRISNVTGANATSNAFFASLPLNTWVQIPGSAQNTNCFALLRSDYLEFGNFQVGAAANAQTFGGLYEWAGAAWDAVNARFYQKGGGHTSTNNNGMYCFDVEAAAGGAAHGGWSVPFQPSVYTVSDFNTWQSRDPQHGDHFEHGWYDSTLVEVAPGAWNDGRAVSQHFYCDTAFSQTNQAVFSGQERAGSPKFWVHKVDGTQIQIPGNAYSNGLTKAGVTEVDETNNVMLGFRNWPGSSADTGVRRFDLANKVDLPPIALSVLTAGSGYTSPGYGPNYLWANNGCGIMSGRNFYYQNSEVAPFLGWVTNIDSFVAKEAPWNAPELPLPGGCYSPDSGFMYAFGGTSHRLMRGVPGLVMHWAYAPEAGSIPLVNDQTMIGPFGRFRYYTARKCLALLNTAGEDAFVMRVA